MNGHDYQKLKLTEEKIKKHNLKFKVKGEFFELSGKGLILGVFITLDELYNYVCGYEAASELNYKDELQ